MRHRLGFGVHSPFAFRFVRDIVQPPRGCGYYSSFRLRRLLAPLPSGLRKEFALLFRLAARLHPRAIYLQDCTDDRLDDALHLGCTSVKCRHRLPKHDVTDALIICAAAGMDCERAAALLNSGNILVLRDLHGNPSLLQSAVEAMPGGWTFEDTRLAILVSSPNEPLNRLSIKLI